MTPQLNAAATEDLHAIRALLSSAALPVEDLSTSPVQFWVARRGQELLGAIGLERYGEVGLLRSLVVTPSVRGNGLGTVLVELLEREANGSGVASLVLLTQSAQDFFTQRGYRAVDRVSIEGTIVSSAEFRSLCPSSAVCMTKRLDWPEASDE